MNESIKFNKYADIWADIFGVLLVLAFGFIPFLLIAEFYTPLSTRFNWWLLLFPFLVGIPSCYLLLRFHKNNKSNEENEEDEIHYIIDKWSIGTLRAKDAPYDLIKSLREIQYKENDKTAKEREDCFTEFHTKEDLLDELEYKLGNIRM
ncbi:MAG: hypothetical protein V3V16_01420, partial [Melioribacteraceae bacterium]